MKAPTKTLFQNFQCSVAWLTVKKTRRLSSPTTKMKVIVRPIKILILTELKILFILKFSINSPK